MKRRIHKVKVSIIIAVYNSEKYIKYSIESIKKQTYKNWELIIINDCSTDSTKEIIDKYKSKKIKIFNLKKKLGAYKATEFAFNRIKGKYVAILDSDDYSHSNRILSQINQLEKNPQIGLVFTKYKCINEKNKIIKNIKKEKSISENKFNRLFPCINLACNSSAMFRKKFIKELIFYNKDFFYSYDYNFYLKIFKVSKIKFINKFYTFYRIHPYQRTNTVKKKIIFKENLLNLKWSANNGLISRRNILFFFTSYLKNFFQYIVS
jgi:glycosyltransferase involved in cell wall biosynthesis